MICIFIRLFEKLRTCFCLFLIIPSYPKPDSQKLTVLLSTQVQCNDIDFEK